MACIWLIRILLLIKRGRTDPVGSICYFSLLGVWLWIIYLPFRTIHSAHELLALISPTKMPDLLQTAFPKRIWFTGIDFVSIFTEGFFYLWSSDPEWKAPIKFVGTKNFVKQKFIWKLRLQNVGHVSSSINVLANRITLAPTNRSFSSRGLWNGNECGVDWGRDKMATLSQTKLSIAFSWIKMLEFRLNFHWSLFLRVHLTICQHWFR